VPLCEITIPAIEDAINKFSRILKGIFSEDIYEIHSLNIFKPLSARALLKQLELVDK